MAAKGAMMLSKEKLRETFSKEPEKYYVTDVFKKEGFARKKCRLCSKYFWSADSERQLCGDPVHEPYSFIKEKPREIAYSEFWNKFSKFFKDEKHTIIERYPVVSRWRQDLYFTIASIQDFQRIEGNSISFEYAANPLLVPQICMRFNDVANVGINGRHFTSFMMAGQHAFNYPKEGYWRDKTIELNFDFLTKVLGVKKNELTYVEDVWAMGDFSEFGPSLESFSNGLEMVNSVFTQFEYANNDVKELAGKVVDVGWGFERLAWYYSGAQTAYDVILKKELDYIYKNTGLKKDFKLYSKIAEKFGLIDANDIKDLPQIEKQILKSAGIPENEYYETIKPMQAAYTIADHTRTLLFAINDGALPSNVGGGYNLRILLRRIFDFMSRYNMNIDLMRIMEAHVRDLDKVYKGMDESLDEISTIINVERRRYENTKGAALKIVTAMIENKEKPTDEKLRMLYESNGITPDFINSVAESKGIKLEIPEEVYTKIMKSDFIAKKKEEEHFDIDIEKLPKTEKLFYKLAYESDSKVLAAKENYAVLDKTPFYAESGGQESDRGTIDEIEVKDVQSVNGIIVHVMVEPVKFREGSKVHCVVDKERRLRLMAHHTATHLISAAARATLGKHAWQEGAKKTPNKAHIDVAHYEKLSDEQIQAIENLANSYITHGIRVSVNELDRKDAETKFGFSIYQGHGAPAKKMRIVEIRDLDGNLIDAEACGGLHLWNHESSIGIIKIINSARIHDGINRIEFVAGPAVLDKINSLEDNIDQLAKLTGIDRDKISSGLSAKLKELELYKERYEGSEELLIRYIAKDLVGSNLKKLTKELNYDRDMLRKIATAFVELKKDDAIVLSNSKHEIVAITGNDSEENALDLAKKHAKELKKEFVGGGTKRIAEGKLR